MFPTCWQELHFLFSTHLVHFAVESEWESDQHEYAAEVCFLFVKKNLETISSMPGDEASLSFEGQDEFHIPWNQLKSIL